MVFQFKDCKTIAIGARLWKNTKNLFLWKNSFDNHIIMHVDKNIFFYVKYNLLNLIKYFLKLIYLKTFNFYVPISI